jgi:hypothetical protein
MFGIFKGERAAMLNLECNQAKTNLPQFRLRDSFEHIRYGYLKVSAKRTLPSESVRLSSNAGKSFYLQSFVDRNLTASAVWHNNCLEIIQLKSVRKLCND